MTGQAPPADDSPIFIVGVPRSGTTLLAAMLGAHPQIACGPETDFFHFIRQADPAWLLDPSGWPQRAVDFMYSWIQARGKAPVPQIYEHTRQSLGMALSGKTPSIPALLDALLQPYAARRGKIRVAEKTPRHMLYLADIRHHYPDARIIKIVRDPRDVALSILKAGWTWAARDLVSGLLMWRDLERTSRTFFETDSCSLTLRYEDLLAHPRQELERICEFVGMGYSDDMLDTRRSYDSVNSIEEPWKRKVGEPLDPSRAFSWKGKLDQQQRRLASSLLWTDLGQYGYEIDITPDPLSVMLVHPFEHLCTWERCEETEAALARPLVSLDDKITARHCLLLGDPEREAWFGHDARNRWYKLGRLSLALIHARLRGGNIHWLTGEGGSATEGKMARLVRNLLSLLGTRKKPCAGRAPEESLRWKINIRQYPRAGALEPPAESGLQTN